VNLVDEDIREDQCRLLRKWRIAIRRLGQDVGRLGMTDQEILSLLHSLGRATLFTLDHGFWKRRLCHPAYCLVYLDIEEQEVAEFVRGTLRHPQLNTRAKRMGAVVRIRHRRISLWRLHIQKVLFLSWEQ
jgi:hypothetical protein